MAGLHLVIESYVDHDHFSHHADPSGATGVVGVHTSSEPHLRSQGKVSAFKTIVNTGSASVAMVTVPLFCRSSLV